MHVPEEHDAVEFAGTGQVVQLVPHAVTSVSALQTPPQLCEPEEHWPLQAAFSAMHTPKHAFCPVGHVGWQTVPSHFALPPVGAWHGEQAAPQWSAELLLTQASPQR